MIDDDLDKKSAPKLPGNCWERPATTPCPICDGMDFSIIDILTTDDYCDGGTGYPAGATVTTGPYQAHCRGCGASWPVKAPTRESELKDGFSIES